MSLAEQLRAAIRADGRSHADIARTACTHQSNLSRFLAGKKEITLTSAEALASAVGVELRVVRPRARRKS